MLNLDLPPSDALIPMTDEERILYEQVVPEDHILRRLQQVDAGAAPVHRHIQDSAGIMIAFARGVQAGGANRAVTDEGIEGRGPFAGGDAPTT